MKEKGSNRSSNVINETILVKDQGILPGAEGFPISPRRHLYGLPKIARSRGIDVHAFQNIKGIGNVLKSPSFKPGLSAKRNDNEKQCPAPKFNMPKEHKKFMDEMKQKGYSMDDSNCDLKRFESLSTNPQTSLIDQKSITEARTILQSEQDNLVINARCPNLDEGEPNLDFVVEGPGPYRYVDVKTPINPNKFPPAKKKPETFSKMSSRMGKKIIKQKGDSDEVLHIVDLDEIPSNMKEKVSDKIVEGAGSQNGIEFINKNL